tara:strand:- start:1268 stop:1477 length:210 start_codon:yes stop_codon:yes gene_type:complete
MDGILPVFAEYGIPGLVIGYLFWANSKKEDRINDLTDRLVNKSEADADRFTKMTLTMERILMAVQVVGK